MAPRRWVFRSGNRNPSPVGTKTPTWANKERLTVQIIAWITTESIRAFSPAIVTGTSIFFRMRLHVVVASVPTRENKRFKSFSSAIKKRCPYQSYHYRDNKSSPSAAPGIVILSLQQRIRLMRQFVQQNAVFCSPKRADFLNSFL